MEKSNNMGETLEDLIVEKDNFPGLTKQGTVRKRRPKQSRNYFTEDTQFAILEYLASNDQAERNRIYNSRINYSFYKLVENIIHTFKFYYMEVDDIEDLKHEVITFLLEKLHLYHQSRKVDEKFDEIINDQFNEIYTPKSFQLFVNDSIEAPTDKIIEFVDSLNVTNDCKEELYKVRPPKAFSYFGTIAKRYLINYNEKNYKKLQTKAPVLAADNDEYIVNDLTLEFEAQDHSTKDFMSMFVEYMDTNLLELFPKEKEAQIADAVLMLFKHKEHIEIFNKKAMFLYIKEMVDVPTRHITKIIIQFKSKYQELYEEYEQTGGIRM